MVKRYVVVCLLSNKRIRLSNRTADFIRAGGILVKEHFTTLLLIDLELEKQVKEIFFLVFILLSYTFDGS